MQLFQHASDYQNNRPYQVKKYERGAYMVKVSNDMQKIYNAINIMQVLEWLHIHIYIYMPLCTAEHYATILK